MQDSSSERQQKFQKKLRQRYGRPRSQGLEVRPALLHDDEDIILAEPFYKSSDIGKAVGDPHRSNDDEDDSSYRPKPMMKHFDEEEETMQSRIVRKRSRTGEGHDEERWPLIYKESHPTGNIKKRRPLGDLSSDDEVRRRNKSTVASNTLDDTETKEERRPQQKKSQIITYRDRAGRRISEREWKELLDRKKKPERKTSRVERVAEKDLAWGGGLVQKQMKKEKQKYEAEVAAEPFTRYEVSEVYDKELREKTLWGDPLPKLSEMAHDTQGRARCKYPEPPNRYTIRPGSRWDGRVRGTNFEAQYLAAIREAKSKEPMFMKRAF